MISSKPINHNKPWTVEDRENLTAMVVAQYDWVMISNILGRTLNATLVEFYRIANHPNKDEVELSRMIQPYKSCYDWKEGHKNPSEIVEELKPNNELKGLSCYNTKWQYLYKHRWAFLLPSGRLRLYCRNRKFEVIFHMVLIFRGWSYISPFLPGNYLSGLIRGWVKIPSCIVLVTAM